MARVQQILKPSQTAVLVVDVQNDFCSPDGATAKAGRSVQACVEMVPRLVTFLARVRGYGVPVIFIQALGTRWTESEAWLYRASEKPRVGSCREGTWGAELYGVAAGPDDAVVIKHRNSGFHATRLDTILRAQNIETVIVTGVATNVSVEMTARDAVQHDYNVVLVEDCCAAFEPAPHEATLYNIRSSYGTVTSANDVLDMWKGYGASKASG
jgi:ureidoacrylate peracid hydrolase